MIFSPVLKLVISMMLFVGTEVSQLKVISVSLIERNLTSEISGSKDKVLKVKSFDFAQPQSFPLERTWKW